MAATGAAAASSSPSTPSTPSSPGRSASAGLVHSSIGLEGALLSPAPPTAAAVDRGHPPLNVLIPMGGLLVDPSTGYPRPLMNIVGRPVLCWLLDHLRLGPADTVWLAVSADIDSTFAVTKQLRAEFPAMDLRFVPLLFPTNGAVETVFVALQAMPDDLLERRTICLNCTTLFFSDILTVFRKVPEGCGASFYFVQNDSDEHGSSYSYIKLDHRGRITDVREKVVISRNANTGAYGFPSARALRAACEGILDHYGGANHTPANLFLSNAILTMLRVQ